MNSSFIDQQSIEPRLMKGINKIGLLTLVQKEIGRFLNVYMQTIIAPLVTLCLYLTVFTVSLSGAAIGGAKEILGVPYMIFLAPGLLMMTMAQNAFSNSSSSLIIAKVQGNIVDILMPPLSATEILFGYLIGALVRSVLIGGVGILIMMLFIDLPVHSLGIIAIFAVLGGLLMGSLGIVAGLWSEKFDHLAAITNFVVTPLTFLSGTFYALTALPEFWQKVALLNPFFYMIDGFRAGFIGVPETNLMTGIVVLVFSNVGLVFLSWLLLHTGYKTKS